MWPTYFQGPVITLCGLIFLTFYFEIAVDSHVFVRNHTEKPSFHPASPNRNILQNYSIITQPGN